jgi:hypothetical protein
MPHAFNVLKCDFFSVGESFLAEPRMSVLAERCALGVAFGIVSSGSSPIVSLTTINNMSHANMTQGV